MSASRPQRWNPVGGFCEKLLPSDRWPWSDVSGLQHRPLDGVALPSPHWEWESDWYVDENFGGEPTEKGGWTYAMDFPATYTRDKKWNSCVRRRRWIRYRRYKSRDTWAKVSDQLGGSCGRSFLSSLPAHRGRHPHTVS